MDRPLSRAPLPARMWLALLLCLMAISAHAVSPLEQQRSQYRDARKALHAGQFERFHQLTSQLESYPLYVYLRYEYLRPRLGSVDEAIISAFLNRFHGTPPAQLLRSRWLRQLASQRNWQTFKDHYLPQDSTELQCQYLRARIETGDNQDVLEPIRDLWLVGKSQPGACDPLFKLLYASPLMTTELRWQRIGLAMNENEVGLAQFLGRDLPVEDNRLFQVWLQARSNPRQALKHKLLDDDGQWQREIVVTALERLARQDVEDAEDIWQDRSRNFAFNAEQRGRVQRELAYSAIRQDHSDILRYLDGVETSQADHRLHKNRIREALLRDAWPELLRWTAEDAHDPPNELRWRYWHARAQFETGRVKAAVAAMQSLAGERDYYGFVAAEHLGVSYSFNMKEVIATPEERDSMLADGAIPRARELRHHGQMVNARREWYREMKKLDPRQQEIAALLAHEWGWHDRAILTLGRISQYDAVSLRFPTPFAPLVNKYAQMRSLPASVMFSIMRSESAFMEDARSPVGALGLMQVMPATGKQTAKLINMKLQRSHDLLRAEINVPIGSAYLKQMLDRFGGRLPMAAAAYNAGPHRVKAWTPDACMTADKWIDTIPFTETRRYVRRTLYNAVIYEWLLNKQVTPITSWLQAIPSKSGSTTRQPVGTCIDGLELFTSAPDQQGAE